MRKLLTRLARSESGNFTLITALSLVPVIGMAGLGVDYAQAYSVWATLQGEADAIAIAVGSEGPDATSRFYGMMTAAAANRVTLGTAQFTGKWTSRTDYEVTATANVPRSFSRLIPVGDATIPVSTKSVARYTGEKLVYKQPELLFLDPDAWDYNQINAYCFDPEKGRTNKAAGRSNSVTIANNIGTKYTDPVPQCETGQILSFELYNIIEGKQYPRNRTDTSKMNRYYTDTTRDSSGRDTYNLGYNLLETILCNTLSECKSKPSGIIPTGSNRTPLRNTLSCEAGKYMYYGWEDRPNGDKDFNDIRIILGCPAKEKAGDESVRLID